MTRHKDLYSHLHELSVGTRFGEYRVTQHLSSEIVAEHVRTGELARFAYFGDNLILRERH